MGLVIPWNVLWSGSRKYGTRLPMVAEGVPRVLSALVPCFLPAIGHLWIPGMPWLEPFSATELSSRHSNEVSLVFALHVFHDTGH